MASGNQRLVKVVEAETTDATPLAVDLFDVAAIVPAGHTSAQGILTLDVEGYSTAADTAGGFRPSRGWKWDTTGGLTLLGTESTGVVGEDDPGFAASITTSGTKLRVSVTGDAGPNSMYWLCRAQLHLRSSDEYVPASFSPLDLNPKLWVRSDEVVKAGTDISEWTDKSGNTHPLLQSDAAKKPDADTVSGLPTVRCDETNHGQAQQAAATDDWSGGYTIVAVLRRYTTSAAFFWSPVVSLGYASNPSNYPTLYLNQWGAYLYHNGTGVNAAQNYNPDTAATYGTDPHWTDLNCIVADWNGAGTNMRVRWNAAAFSTAAGASAPGGAGKISIGNVASVSGYSDLSAHVYEVLVFAPKLSDSDLSDLYDYLETYYGGFGA